MSEHEPKDFEFGSGHPVTMTGRRAPGHRALIIALIIVLVTGAGGAYLYFDKTLARKLLENTPLALPASVTKVYKWKDADGVWQITDRPPAEGTPFETLEYASDTNVMPLVPREE